MPLIRVRRRQRQADRSLGGRGQPGSHNEFKDGYTVRF